MQRSSSSSDEDKRQSEKYEVERRASTASVRSGHENLADLPDVDAGKSPEERAKIVRQPNAIGSHLVKLYAGQSFDVEGGQMAHSVALLAVSTQLSGSNKHWKCSTCAYGAGFGYEWP